MKRFLHRALFSGALLAGVLLARAGVSYDESPLLVFDTRDYTAGLAAESATFAFDTRIVDGLGGSNFSSTFILDTRSSKAVGLVISGPTAVNAGSENTQIVLMNQSGNPVDVSALSTIQFVGAAPANAGIGGRTVFVNRNAPVVGISRAIKAHGRMSRRNSASP